MADAHPSMLKPQRLVPMMLVIVLTALVAIAALPSYLSGTWPWSQPLSVPRVEQLQALMEKPLVLPNWNLANHQEVNISGNRWSLAEYQPPTGAPASGFPAVIMLLRPQLWHTNQPEVEWLDISGSQDWQADHHRRLQFTTADGTSVTARYFRGITDRSTFAVVQWYAWADGGHPSPSHWFWLDQMRQWQRRERLPWVAVSLLLPIEPVGDIGRHVEAAQAIAETVQTALVNTPFQGME